jgi:hypothetical protein
VPRLRAFQDVTVNTPFSPLSYRIFGSNFIDCVD